jgi:SAM-dependent methyltransferase
MSKEAMKPFGSALEDYHNGNHDISIIFHRDDGEKTEDFLKGYFCEYSDFPEREKIAIKNCDGRVLDIGAGAGRHSLELQKRGLEVLAIDISEKACEVMRKRGVKNVKCKTPYELDEGKFDTILLLGCSIAFVEDIKGLKKFLRFAKEVLLKPDGRILMDSRDVRKTDNPKHIEYQEMNIESGRYRGEIRIQIEYKGKKGKMFQILHIDPDKLEDVSKKTGWKCKILSKGNGSLYLAELTPIN